MKLKQGVSLAGINPKMRHAMREADAIWKQLGREAVITSGTEAADNEGNLYHSAGSLHYSGLAIDLRTRYFNDGGQAAAGLLRERLRTFGPGFQVVLESNHIHVEYDPK